MRTLSLLNPELRSPSGVRMAGRLSVWAERAVVACILLAFVLIGICFSVVVPIFEAPDEIHHYAFARHLSQGNDLPIQTVDSSGPWEHEGTQAPLYYLLLGRLIAGIDQGDFDELRQINPHANLGNPLYPGNKNYMLYSAVEHPLARTNLAVHIGRWFSLSLMVLTLLFVYGIARLAFPDSQALPLLTLGTVAAIPQVQFIGATISNDNMVILCGSAVLFWLARLVSRPREMPIYRYEWWLLGVLLGLAALSKLQGLGLILLAGLATAGLAWFRRERWLLLQLLVPVGLPILLIAGWWYWRNYVLYGEWLGVEQLLSINGLRQEVPTLAQLWGELRGVRYSFWGLFGWFSILLPGAIYTVLDWLSVGAIAGVLGVQLARWRREGRTFLGAAEQRVYLVLVVWIVLLVALLLYWLTFAASGQGRLLFPALGGIGVFMVMGLAAWLRFLSPGWRMALLALLPVGMLSVSLYALIVLLPGQYQAPAARAALPPGAIPQQVLIGDAIELVAVSLPQERYRTGDQVKVTLYWRSRAAMAEDYPLFLQLQTLDRQVIGNVTTHPGWGRLPTTLWRPGELYPDPYQVQIEGDIGEQSPLLATITVGFLDAGGHRLPITVDDGTTVDHIGVGAVTVVPPAVVAQIPDLQADRTDFDGVIRLAAYAFEDQVRQGVSSLPVVLVWEAIARPAQNYTAFVHLIDAQGRQMSGYDQAPAADRFPTRYWHPDDRSVSHFPLTLPVDLPSGDYEIWVGLYGEGENAERLPVTNSPHPVQDRRILLGTVRILPPQ